MSIKPIETHYAGCRFRSRLEARYAVLFDHIGARWQYEPQGFVIDGRPYLPDFLLPDHGIWVEVKGAEESLDKDLMRAAAGVLPAPVQRWQPSLLILGPVPEPRDEGDWGWLGLYPEQVEVDHFEVFGGWWGLGSYRSTREVVALRDTSSAPPDQYEEGIWTEPALDPYAPSDPGAYAAARAARFEHGESG